MGCEAPARKTSRLVAPQTFPPLPSACLTARKQNNNNGAGPTCVCLRNTTVYHLQRREGIMNQPNVRVGLQRDVNSRSEGRQARAKPQKQTQRRSD